jgi:DNA-binding beta-propeller fold protein YncE
VANNLGRSLSVLDLETRAQIALVPLSAAPQDVTIDARDGRVYASLPGAGGVAVIAPDTLTQVLTLTVGTTPSGLLVDDATRRLIVTHRHPLFNSLGLYALPEGEPFATWPVGAEPNAVARDPRSGALFSADVGGRSVTVLSAEGEQQRILGLPEAVWQVAYSQRSGRLLALCPASQSLHVLAPDTGATLLSQPVGQGSGAGLAIDQASGRIYVTNSADDTLTILRDQGGAAGPWLPMVLKNPTAQPQTYAASSEQGVDAVMASQPGLRALPLLLEANTARHHTLAFDELRRRVAISMGERVSLMEATEGRPLAEWRLPEQVTALAFAKETGRLYAALAELGALYVLVPGQAPRLLAAELGHPTSLAWGDGRLYLTDLTGRRVVVVVQDGGIIVVSYEAVTPHGLALDTARQRLYVGDVSAGAILALDAITLQPLGRVVLGGLGLPNSLALSADGERLYVSHALSPKYGALTSLDPLTMEHRTTLWGHPSLPLWGAGAVAIGSDGEVLLSTAHDVLRLDGASLARRGVLERALPTGGGSLAASAQGESVYGLSATGQLWRWQAPDDGKTNSP